MAWSDSFSFSALQVASKSKEGERVVLVSNFFRNFASFFSILCFQ